MIENTPGAPSARPSSASRVGPRRTKEAGETKDPDAADASAETDREIEQRRSQFDMVLKYNAEMERELNLLREMMLEQMKKDDEFVKEMIRLI